MAIANVNIRIGKRGTARHIVFYRVSGESKENAVMNGEILNGTLTLDDEIRFMPVHGHTGRPINAKVTSMTNGSGKPKRMCQKGDTVRVTLDGVTMEMICGRGPST